MTSGRWVISRGSVREKPLRDRVNGADFPAFAFPARIFFAFRDDFDDALVKPPERRRTVTPPMPALRAERELRVGTSCWSMSIIEPWLGDFFFAFNWFFTLIPLAPRINLSRRGCEW